MVILEEIYSNKNEDNDSEMISVAARLYSKPSDNFKIAIQSKNGILKNETVEIEKIFQHRYQILQRSCEFINKLNAANRIANVSELQDIHLLLHDLTIPHELIVKKLLPYENIEIEVYENQENFIYHKYFKMAIPSVENVSMACIYRRSLVVLRDPASA